MARTTKLPTMRVVTAVNARCYPTGDVREAFFVDGRSSGQRDMRMVDRVSEREDSTFVQTIFAYPEKNWSPDRNVFSGMQELSARMAQGELDWDGDEAPIDYLGDCAVTLLSGDGIRTAEEHSPFFGGITICGDEFAALTMGKVCALLYRERILYPLVGNENWLEPYDIDGNLVEQFKAFIGDSQVPLRSSLVAKALPGDLLILCNVELATTLGQRALMDAMIQATHPGDIAEQLVGEAARQKLGMPMICLVSQIVTINKDSGNERKAKAGFTSRFNPSALTKAQAVATPTPSATSFQTDMGDAATRRYDPSSLPPVPAATPNQSPLGAYDAPTFDSSFSQWDKSDEALGTRKRNFANLEDDFEDRAPSRTYPKPMANQYNAPQPNAQYDEYDEDYDDYEEPNRLQGFWKRGYWIVLGLLVLVIIGSIISFFIGGGSKDPVTTTPVVRVTTKAQAQAPKVTTVPAQQQPTTAPEVTVPVPQQPEVPAVADGTTHTVVSGDTLWGIASKYYGANKVDETVIDKIRKANNMTDDTLQVGKKLVIPKN